MNPTAKTGSSSAESGIFDNSKLANRPAEIIMGIDIKKENRAALGRSRTRTSPPVIVAPEREIPGNRARICAIPIQMASAQVISFKDRERWPNFSEITNNMAVISKKTEVAPGLPKAFSRVPLKINPNRPAGMVAMIRSQASFDYGCAVGCLWRKSWMVIFVMETISVQK